MYYVYILRSQKVRNKFYIGFTSNLENRLEVHSTPAKDQYTYRYYPWELETHITFKDKTTAKRFEAYLKSSSGRTFIKRHLV